MIIPQNTHDNKQLMHNAMNTLIQFLSILIVLNVAHRIVLFLQVHELLLVQQAIFMFMTQCKIILFIFNGIPTVIDILMQMSLLELILTLLTVIDDATDVNLATINEFIRINDNTSNETVVFLVEDFGFYLGAILFSMQIMGNMLRARGVFAYFVFFVEFAVDLSLLLPCVFV